MILVYDKNRKKIGVLQNALNIRIREKINSVDNMEFELPMIDEKNKLCQPFNYVRYTEEGQLFRIMPNVVERDETGVYKYECEHVIATLIDKVLFGWHEVGNLGYYTRNCINYVLSKQSDWKLGRCDFSRQFQYGWEQESLLSALFSIPKPINDEYLWTYDTINYPWTLNLIRINKNVDSKDTIMLRRNMLRLVKSSSPFEICTRIYPLGYGEGVNQLNIKSVNGGVPYLQSPQSIINKYGIVERVWTDRRYESAETLKAAAQKMLNEMQEPIISYEAEAAYIDADIGDVVRVIDQETGTDIKSIIVEKETTYDDVVQTRIVIQNKTTDIAGTIADLMDRQKVETTYAQGATQIYAQSLQVNASSQDGAQLNFYIPSEMRVVNKVKVKVIMERFRAYSRATDGGGGDVYTSEDGGACEPTSEATTDIIIELSEAEEKLQTSQAASGSMVTGYNPAAEITTNPVSDGSAIEPFQSTTEQTPYGQPMNMKDWHGNPTGPQTINNIRSAGDVDVNEGSGSVNTGVFTTSPGGQYQQVVMTAKNETVTYRNSTTTDENVKPERGHNHGVDRDVLNDTKRLAVVNWENEIVGSTGFVESGKHNHSIELQIEGHSHPLTLNIPGHTHQVDISQHTHNITIPGHSHKFDITNHYHDYRIPAHTHPITDKKHKHKVVIEAHKHKTIIPNHQHPISPGIYRFGYANSFALYVNGRYIRSYTTQSEELDITNYLFDSYTNTLKRGAWHSVKVVPNDLAYVSIDMNLQGFIQSRGGINA